LRQKNRKNADAGFAEVLNESTHAIRNIFECMLVVGLWVDVVHQCERGIDPRERVRNPEDTVRPRVGTEDETEVPEQDSGFVSEESSLKLRS